MASPRKFGDEGQCVAMARSLLAEAGRAHSDPEQCRNPRYFWQGIRSIALQLQNGRTGQEDGQEGGQDAVVALQLLLSFDQPCEDRTLKTSIRCGAAQAVTMLAMSGTLATEQALRLLSVLSSSVEWTELETAVSATCQLLLHGRTASNNSRVEGGGGSADAWHDAASAPAHPLVTVFGLHRQHTKLLVRLVDLVLQQKVKFLRSSLRPGSKAAAIRNASQRSDRLDRRLWPYLLHHSSISHTVKFHCIHALRATCCELLLVRCEPPKRRHLQAEAVAVAATLARFCRLADLAMPMHSIADASVSVSASASASASAATKRVHAAALVQSTLDNDSLNELRVHAVQAAAACLESGGIALPDSLVDGRPEELAPFQSSAHANAHLASARVAVTLALIATILQLYDESTATEECFASWQSLASQHPDVAELVDSSELSSRMRAIGARKGVALEQLSRLLGQASGGHAGVPVAHFSREPPLLLSWVHFNEVVARLATLVREESAPLSRERLLQILASVTASIINHWPHVNSITTTTMVSVILAMVAAPEPPYTPQRNAHSDVAQFNFVHSQFQEEDTQATSCSFDIARKLCDLLRETTTSSDGQTQQPQLPSTAAGVLNGLLATPSPTQVLDVLGRSLTSPMSAREVATGPQSIRDVFLRTVATAGSTERTHAGTRATSIPDQLLLCVGSAMFDPRVRACVKANSASQFTIERLVVDVVDHDPSFAIELLPIIQFALQQTISSDVNTTHFIVNELMDALTVLVRHGACVERVLQVLQHTLLLVDPAVKPHRVNALLAPTFHTSGASVSSLGLCSRLLCRLCKYQSLLAPLVASFVKEVEQTQKISTPQSPDLLLVHRCTVFAASSDAGAQCFVGSVGEMFADPVRYSAEGECLAVLSLERLCRSGYVTYLTALDLVRRRHPNADNTPSPVQMAMCELFLSAAEFLSEQRADIIVSLAEKGFDDAGVHSGDANKSTGSITKIARFIEQSRRASTAIASDCWRFLSRLSDSGDTDSALMAKWWNCLASVARVEVCQADRESALLPSVLQHLPTCANDECHGKSHCITRLNLVFRSARHTCSTVRQAAVNFLVEVCESDPVTLSYVRRWAAARDNGVDVQPSTEEAPRSHHPDGTMHTLTMDYTSLNPLTSRQCVEAHAMACNAATRASNAWRLLCLFGFELDTDENEFEYLFSQLINDIVQPIQRVKLHSGEFEYEDFWLQEAIVPLGWRLYIERWLLAAGRNTKHNIKNAAKKLWAKLSPSFDRAFDCIKDGSSVQNINQLANSVLAAAALHSLLPAATCSSIQAKVVKAISRLLSSDSVLVGWGGHCVVAVATTALGFLAHSIAGRPTSRDEDVALLLGICKGVLAKFRAYCEGGEKPTFFGEKMELIQTICSGAVSRCITACVVMRNGSVYQHQLVELVTDMGRALVTMATEAPTRLSSHSIFWVCNSLQHEFDTQFQQVMGPVQHAVITSLVAPLCAKLEQVPCNMTRVCILAVLEQLRVRGITSVPHLNESQQQSFLTALTTLSQQIQQADKDSLPITPLLVLSSVAYFARPSEGTVITGPFLRAMEHMLIEKTQNVVSSASVPCILASLSVHCGTSLLLTPIDASSRALSSSSELRQWLGRRATATVLRSFCAFESTCVSFDLVPPAHAAVACVVRGSILNGVLRLSSNSQQQGLIGNAFALENPFRSPMSNSFAANQSSTVSVSLAPVPTEFTSNFLRILPAGALVRDIAKELLRLVDEVVIQPKLLQTTDAASRLLSLSSVVASTRLPPIRLAPFVNTLAAVCCHVSTSSNADHNTCAAVALAIVTLVVSRTSREPALGHAITPSILESATPRKESVMADHGHFQQLRYFCAEHITEILNAASERTKIPIARCVFNWCWLSWPRSINPEGHMPSKFESVFSNGLSSFLSSTAKYTKRFFSDVWLPWWRRTQSNPTSCLLHELSRDAMGTRVVIPLRMMLIEVLRTPSPTKLTTVEMLQIVWPYYCGNSEDTPESGRVVEFLLRPDTLAIVACGDHDLKILHAALLCRVVRRSTANIIDCVGGFLQLRTSNTSAASMEGMADCIFVLIVAWALGSRFDFGLIASSSSTTICPWELYRFVRQLGTRLLVADRSAEVLQRFVPIALGALRDARMPSGLKTLLADLVVLTLPAAAPETKAKYWSTIFEIITA